MSTKRKNFLISNSILIAFIVIMVLIANYYLVTTFGFNEDTFIAITLLLIIFAVVLNYFLSKPLFDPLFKSDKNLQKTIKETLHELNIPASTIQANVQLLEKNIKDEKNAKRLQRIKLATNELLKLYNQMEYEIKKEIDRIDKQEFLIDEILENSIDKFEDIKGTITIENSVKNIIINSDKNGFQKIIDNLLSNAIKYNCNNGTVKIDFKDGILSIFNTGKSIDTKNLFIVFDQYFQEDITTKGFGLGLNMVKEFCDKNQIEIKIEPKTNGTQIKLNLTKSIS
ncbi:sensor histidine kinase [Arcobacter sp.]|uniref:sensor histidine kinase n=1 Tax=Arcobacter sp. TaxID=1872629 RepID=UPI003D152636